MTTIDVEFDNTKDFLNNLKEVGGTYETGIFDSEPATYMTYNEHGTATIPARPWLSTSAGLDRNKKAFFKIIDKVYDGADGKSTRNRAKNFLTKIVKAKIMSNIQPANAPSTLAQKSGNKTLRDTDTALKSVETRYTKG